MNNYFSTNLTKFRKSLNNGFAPNSQFAQNQLGITAYTGDPSVYGAFDAFTNKYIIALEEINRYNSQGYPIFHQDAATLSFLEVGAARGGEDEIPQLEGFESFLSYHPEMMTSLDSLFITFKNGQLWKHTTDSMFCNFYGVQYGASITSVFNDSPLEKKTWQTITELSDDLWECPSILTNVNSYDSVFQKSFLIPQNFTRLESNWHATVRRDANSNGGIYNGDFLKGNYLIVKFLKQNANVLVYLNGVSIKYISSPLTNR
jgi:hypothetical protein